MDSEAPIGGKRRGFRRRRWLVSCLLGLPAGIILLGNLSLSTPWACRWIASKIERRTGMETRVGGASWSPWNGAAIDAVELLQPAPLRAALKQPLVRIDSLRVIPVWKAWLRGRLEVRSIALDTPRFFLPLELVSHLARPAPPAQQAPPPPPPVAAATPPPAAVQPGPPAPTPPAAVSPPKPPAPPSQPTGWLHLKNASFTVVHAGSHRTLIEISKITGSVPIAGDPAQAALKIDSVSAFGNELARNLAAQLDWTYPLLSLKPLETEIAGYKLILAGRIASFSGLPIQIDAQLPRQALAAVRLPFDSQATAEAIAANARFRGLLLAPGTWQGDLIAESVAPAIRVADRETKFDRGSAVTVLRGGAISCVDARLIGDELSLLGNATLLADGRAAGAARLVAAPESATAMISRIFPRLAAPSLTPLATPQRTAFDLEAFGNISQLFLRLGKDGPVVNLKN
jgi:hypothetical protein